MHRGLQTLALIALVPTVACSTTTSPDCSKVELRYAADDTLLEKHTDTNRDCLRDEHVYYRDGTPERAEADRDHDGRIDLWIYYDDDGETIRRIERDTDGDGRPDVPSEPDASAIPPTSPDHSQSGPSSDPAGDCFARAEVKKYLIQIQEQTLTHWTLPPGIDPDQSVTMKFRIDDTGRTSDVSIVESENAALGTSAVAALQRASPFSPLPEGAACLATVPITGTFANPASTASCGLGWELALLLPLLQSLRRRRRHSPDTPAQRRS